MVGLDEGPRLELRISAETDRAGVEALQLEIRRLAERLGLTVAAVRIVRVDAEGSGAAPSSAEIP
jgi:hypothetical protein